MNLDQENITTVRIKRNTCGDSRVASEVPTIDEFAIANASHITEVAELMRILGMFIVNRGKDHDWSKMQEPYKSTFYREMCASIEGKDDFLNGEWCKYHYETERHHLNRAVPGDVNLMDVIEMICDCVAAGLARSGEVRPLTIDSDVLQKAFQNTARLVEHMCKLEDGDE